MKRGQVTVRAIDETGKWGEVDALDLDDASFRAFVLDVLYMRGLLYGRELPAQHISLKARTGVRAK